jgi:hypothetical protein
MTRKKLFVPPPTHRWDEGVPAGGVYSTPEAYLSGYYEAGKILAERARGRSGIDLLYPICFNYRHYIELSLKYLVIVSEEVADIMDEIGYLRGKLLPSVRREIDQIHSIERLLRSLEERLAVLSDEPLPSEARTLIIEFHNIDPDGQTFRYPTRKGGVPTFPISARYNVESIRTGMVTVHRCFLGIDGWLEHTRQQAIDYLETLHEAMGERSDE